MSTEPPATGSPPPEVAAGDDEQDGRWQTSLAVPVLIVTIAIGLIGAIIWVAREEQDAGAEALAGTTVEGPLPVTVPYREVGGAIVIDVTFGDGSRTAPMILDTGAPTVINEDLAATFAGDTLGTIAGASADGQVVTSEVVRLPRVAIGEAVFHDVGAAVGAIEPGNPFRCVTDAGFVGASLMQAASWRIDPGAGTVTIAAATEDLDTDGHIRLDMTRSSEVSPSPSFELGAGQGSLAFLADTGSDGWLAVHPADLDGLGLPPPASAPVVRVLGHGAAGPFTTDVRWIAPQLTLGDQALATPLALTEALPQGQGLAGTDFLRHFLVTFAWDEDALYLDPIEPAAEVSPSAPSSVGLGWDEGYVVGSLVEGATASHGLVLGSPVIAIDGTDVTRAPFDDYCARVVRGGGPETSELTVAGDPPSIVSVARLEGFFEDLP